MVNMPKIKCENCGYIEIGSVMADIHEELGYCPFIKKGD